MANEEKKASGKPPAEAQAKSKQIMDEAAAKPENPEKPADVNPENPKIPEAAKPPEKQPAPQPPVEQKAQFPVNTEQEEQEAVETAKLLKKYGTGFIKVEKNAGVGGKMMTKIFSAMAWKNLGPAKADGSKAGWKPVVKTPPEVKNLKK